MVRYGLRALWKTPAFTLGAILTIALAVGATTAIFTVVYGVLLRRLPYEDVDRATWSAPDARTSGPECAMVGTTTARPRTMRSWIGAGTLVRASPQQASCDVHGEVVILDVEKGAYYGLEEVGARVWELLQEPRRVLEIREILAAEFDVSSDQCERDLVSFLEDLADAGLLQCEPPHVAESHPDPAG